MLDLASNDYLGLARDPRVAAAAARAALRWGAGSTGSRLVTGSTRLHHELEDDLASHVGSEAALVFSSGYLANMGAVAALAGPDCVIISDRLNHASLIDACRLSRSRVVVVEHADHDAMERALATRREPRALLVSDSVFSVDGDAANVHRLHDIARSRGAMLVVDEAHALGVVGDRGQGACSAAGISGEPDVVMTLTLSKSLASQGGAVAASSAVVRHLINAARSFVFDTALAPPSAGAALAALRILAEQPDLPATARDRARSLRLAANRAGWSCSPPDGAVLAIPINSPAMALAAAEHCLRSGVRVGCFRPPSVPDSRSRLRLTARATLSTPDLELAATTLMTAARMAGG